MAIGVVPSVCLGAGQASGAAEPELDLFEMSLEQLMEEEITSTATLTETSARTTPAAVTTITVEQIEASGARSLFELLDIYVPNLQWARNAWEADNLGLRGIMTDRDDKYLLLVNGRVMNERTHYGVVSERDLVMLTDTSLPSGGAQEGEPLLNPSIPNDGEDARGLPPLKFYGELNRNGWDVWARFTRGGKQFVWDAEVLASAPYGWAGSWIVPYVDSFYAYQQATFFLGKSITLGERTTLEASFSYDMFDFERQVHSWLLEAFREDKYLGKAVLRHDISERHKVALGTEVLHGEYGFSSPGWPESDAVISQVGSPAPRWSTNLYSVFAPTAKDTYKLMWARSVRANYEEQLKLADVPDSRPEKLDSVELRYERQHSTRLDLAASAFVHYNLELIGWDAATSAAVPVATQRDWGIEVEASYHTEKTRLTISHGFTKLYDFNLEPGAWSNISAMGWGYGSDLGRWSNHVTKITARHRLDDRWTADGSLRVYWGFPGHEDFTDYVHDSYLAGGGSDTLAAPGWERSYHASPYLNLGLQYQPNERLTCRLDGYYLLGIFNKDFNKRIYGGNNPCYRSHAPAVAASLIYRF